MTQRIKLIGLTGYQGTGKDTVAHQLHLHGFLRYALAEPIKQALLEMFQLDSDTFTDRRKKEDIVDEIGRSPRYLAQTLGTEWGRRLVADDLWVRVMRMHVSSSIRLARGVVVSDVRFDNEARAIRDMGGIVIRVKRPSVDQPMEADIRRSRWRRRMWRCGLPIHPGVHPSEFGVSDALVDTAIVNDRSIGHLADVVDSVVADLDSVGPDALWQIREWGQLSDYRAAS